MFKHLFKSLKQNDDRTVRLYGERCNLRTFAEEDAKDLADLLSRNKYFWSQFEPLHRDEFYTVAAQREKILDSLQMMSMKREYTFGVYTKDTEQLIGHISLYAIKRMPYSSAFVGYAIDEQFVRRGIATDAVKTIIAFGFEALKLHRVEAYIAPANVGSIRVIEKAGFKCEGLMRELLYINGKWMDHYMYAIIRDE